MTRSFFVRAAAVVTVAAAATPAVSAAQGTVLNFGGSVQVRDFMGGGSDFLALDFLPLDEGMAFPGTGNINVDFNPDADNDFVGIAPGQGGTIRDLVVTETGLGGPTPAPVANFVQFGDYSFSLTGVTTGGVFGPIFLTQVGSNVSASFAVQGIVTGGGFPAEGRAYNGLFTSQFVNTNVATLVNDINAGGSARNTFSATFRVGVIPEPSTYALMAAGVAMLGAFARRRQQQA